MKEFNFTDIKPNIDFINHVKAKIKDPKAKDPI